MGRAWRTACVALLMCAPPGAGDAAAQTPEGVTPEVMQFLLRGNGPALGDQFALHVTVPPGFPAELLPPGARVSAAGVTERVTVIVGLLVVTAFPHLTVLDVQFRVMRPVVQRTPPPMNFSR